MEKEPMWKDERYYLEDANEYDREPIYELRNDVIFMKSVEENRNRFLIQKYDSFIEKVSRLIQDISLKDNSLSAILSTGILLSHGMFSVNGKLVYDESNFDTLHFKLGVDAVRGYGQCRHFSSFIDDVMKNLDVKSDVFSCNFTDIYSEISLISSPASHMTNLIYYNNVPYVFDVLNYNGIFSFVDEFKAVSVDYTNPLYYHYKPYYEMFYYGKTLQEVKEQLEIFRKSIGKSITEKEFLEIENETRQKLDRDMDLIYDFILDTDYDLKVIDNETEKTIIKRILKK